MSVDTSCATCDGCREKAKKRRRVEIAAKGAGYAAVTVAYHVLFLSISATAWRNAPGAVQFGGFVASVLILGAAVYRYNRGVKRRAAKRRAVA